MKLRYGMIAPLLLASFFASSAQSIFGPGSGAGGPTGGQYAVNDNVNLQVGTTSPSIQTPQSSCAKTVKSSTIAASSLILITLGQSLIVNFIPSAYTLTNTNNVFNLNIYDGVNYQGGDPECGTMYPNGNYITPLADKLITDGKFSNVYLIPISVGGAGVLDWTPGGPLNSRIRIACLRMRQLGWIGLGGTKYGIIWDQGQSDVTAGTSSANYQALFTQMRKSFVGYGCDFDTFVATDTMLNNVTNATIQGAQAALVDNDRVFAGANIDSIPGTITDRQVDLTHLNNTGGTLAAGLWATVLEAHY